MNSLTIDPKELADRLEENWPAVQEFFARRNWPDTKLGRAAAAISNDVPGIATALRTAAAALEHADQMMFGRIGSECVPLNDDETRWGPTGEDLEAVDTLEKASQSLREAFEWLSARGLAKLVTEDGRQHIELPATE